MAAGQKVTRLDSKRVMPNLYHRIVARTEKIEAYHAAQAKKQAAKGAH